jgi:hypothetical protein
MVGACGIPLFNDDVLALYVAERPQAASEGVEVLFIRPRCSEESNTGDFCRLLRARRERPIRPT